MAEAGATHTPLIRARSKVRLMPLVALIFFSVSGGAYGLEPLLSSSGPGMAMILLFVTPLIYSVPVALFTAELSSAMPTEGGVYQWVKKALGDFWGYQEGMLFWITSWVDMAVYPVMFGDYAAQLVSKVGDGQVVFLHLGWFDFDLHWLVGVLCVIVPFTLLNIRGAKNVGDSSVFLTIVALVPFALLAIWGIPQLFTHHVDPVTPMTAPGTSVLGAFGAGLWVVMWNYNGFDSVSTIAEEVENPRRNIPRALFYSILLIVAAYVIPVLGGMAAGGWENWQDGSFAGIGGQLAGPWLKYVIIVGGLAAMAGMYSSLLLSNSRIPFVLAEDGWVPKKLVKVSPRFGTPVVAIVLCSVLYTVFSTGGFKKLVVADVFLTNVTLLLELIALIVLRVKQPDMERPFKVPGGWFGLTLMSVPLVGVIVWAAYEQFQDSGWEAVWWSGGAIALSFAYYPVARWLRSRHLAEKATPGDVDMPTPLSV